MKNIYEILKSFELTVPEDKKEDFDKVLNENYKTISEVIKIQGKLEKAEGERDTYKTKYWNKNTFKHTEQNYNLMAIPWSYTTDF